MTTDLGDTYSTGFEVENSASVLTTPATHVCTITLPDGTTVTPTLTVASTGVLRLDYATVQEGGHHGRVVTTTPDSSQPFDFNVGPAFGRGIVSLADARAKLNFNRTVNDEELRGYIDEATDYIEGLIGPVVRRTIVEKVTPASGLLFTAAPIVSLTTMTDTYGHGWTYDVANFSPDGSMIAPLANVTPPCYPVTVTYVGGRAVIDPLIRGAALDYVKWAWESQRGPGGGEPGGQVDEFAPGVPATPPYKIAAKLARYMPAVVA